VRNVRRVRVVVRVVRPGRTRTCGSLTPDEVHDQRRQHELGLEMKWVNKDDNAGKFRMFTTIFGMVAIDTMLGLMGQSHTDSKIRTMTTKDFADFLAEEMVDNELDGTVVRPPLDKRRSLNNAATIDEVADND